MRYNLDEFRSLDPVKGVPTISITRNGITFNQAAIVKLNKPGFVRFLLNDEKKVLAVVVCTEDVPGAMKFFNPDKKVISVRIGNSDLRKYIKDLMDWDLESSSGYRIKGEYDKDQDAIFFELGNARPMILSEKNGEEDSAEGDEEEEA